MPSSEFNKGFAAGWRAASQAIFDAMGEQRSPQSLSTPSLETAGNIPSAVRRPRGRPPKSKSALSVSQAPAKRGRGRPRKST